MTRTDTLTREQISDEQPLRQRLGALHLAFPQQSAVAPKEGNA